MSHHMNWNTWPVCSSRIGVRAQLFVSWPVKRNKILGVTFPLCASDQHHNVHTCNIIIRTPERRGHISFLVQYFTQNTVTQQTVIQKKSIPHPMTHCHHSLPLTPINLPLQILIDCRLPHSEIQLLDLLKNDCFCISAFCLSARRPS